MGHIINDETIGKLADILHPKEFGKGLDLATRPNPGGLGYGALASVPFNPDWLVPRHEWQARIEERQRREWQLSDRIRLAKLPAKQQGHTNLCWANAPTACVEVNRIVMNQPLVILSPASVAGPINGYRNEGGWGLSALKRLVSSGAVPVEHWPANAIDRKFGTEANWRIGQAYRCVKWCELEPGNLDQLISMLFRNIPVAVGLSWWGHEVYACDPQWVDGAIAYRFRNSWGQWGTTGEPGQEGFSVLQGSKMNADDAVCPMSAKAS